MDQDKNPQTLSPIVNAALRMTKAIHQPQPFVDAEQRVTQEMRAASDLAQELGVPEGHPGTLRLAQALEATPVVPKDTERKLLGSQGRRVLDALTALSAACQGSSSVIRHTHPEQADSIVEARNHAMSLVNDLYQMGVRA